MTNRAPLSKSQVLRMYKQAADNVKLRCPGFVRTIDNDIYEVNANGKSALFLNAAFGIFAEDDFSSDSTLCVAQGDDLACRMFFPVYDTDYGCKFYDGSSVKDAMCYDNGSTYEIIILFYEQETAAGISEEFEQMMTPFSQETLLQNLNAYFPMLHESNCDTSLRYYNCEIHCTLDKNSGHILALSQKMVTQVNVDVNLDMVLTESSFSTQATMINHLTFSEFNWK